LGVFSAYLGMEHDRVLTLAPVNHPNRQVRRVGFDLSDTYVEQCWSAVVGPSAVLLLRRMPQLWRHETPARIPANELSRSIGLGAGTGTNSRLMATMDRLTKFGLAHRGTDPDRLDVYLEVAPLHAGQLQRVPEWTRATHERLFGAHLEGFDGVAEHRAKVTDAAVDLDRFRDRATRADSTQPAAQQALGR
jgi:hypothetical protein